MSESNKHQEFEALLTDYLDERISHGDRRRLEAHLEGCADCRESLDELRETVRALSGLHKISAPQDFDDKVGRTIERRSRGRFFGRRAFGDRVPFELLALVALLLAVSVFVALRLSGTGAFNLGGGTDEPEIHDSAREVVPKP